MVAKISFGSSLYGALAYNGEKINKEEGKLLATNKIFDDCSGKTSITNALRDFQRYLSPHIRTEKPVVHISLNPHPDDVLTDMEMENIAREYLERMGYGNQPYMVYKHEDIDRHHMHIVTIRVDENGKCLDSRYNYHRSKAITRDLEEKYNLHKADRKQRQADNPLRKVDISQGNVKKQVANTVKSLCATYRFQSLGEYRALLSLYNISLEEVRGEVGGREYHGFVYSATNGQGNKVGNPFKASKIDRSVGAEAIEKRFAYSAKKFREDKKLSEMTRHSVEAVLKQTYHKDKFIEMLKAKGIDVVSAIQLTAVSTEQHSLTTAPKACSMVQGLERIFLPMPFRSTSPCITRMSNRYRLPFQRKMALSWRRNFKAQDCSTSTAAVLDLCLEEVHQMRHRKQHSTENYAERKRSAKGEAFSCIIKIGFLEQWRKPALCKIKV